MRRREFLPALGALAQSASAQAKRGRIKQSVCSSVFKRGTPIEDQYKLAAELGFLGFDLQTPDRFPLLKKYGLISAMTSGGGGTIPDALNRKENHAAIEEKMRSTINLCAEAGSPNLITFSGNRRGMSDEEATENCRLFLDKIKAQAEDKGVTICMELLNSRVNHKDYQCDHVDWGVELAKRVNSPRFKLLFDIYHMQIMDGDIVHRIRDGFQWLGHFHTGGVPGRHEIDNDSQELNYHFVAQAIADLGYQGFVAHEYSPVRDPMESLKQAREIFTV